MMDSLPTYRPWMNVALYQGAWFVCVLGRERFVLIAVVLVGIHLALCRDRGTEIRLMLGVAALGAATDSALTLAGVFAFDPAPSVLPVPFWLVVIWLAFAATLRHALVYVLARAPLAIVAGAIGGPLSYVGAARLGAVSLPLGPSVTLATLALVWAVLMVLLVAVARRFGPIPRLAPT